MDIVITGASRGIGRALVLALATQAGADDRLFLLARDGARLEQLRAEITGRVAVDVLATDLARADLARAAGDWLSARMRPGSLLVHNAGVWPHRLQLVDGLERAYATNCVCPLVLQQPLLDAGRLARVLVISAGLLIKGKFDAERTPSGRDFGAIHTYCSTKLAGAVAMRELARRYPQVDLAVIHPGVVKTDLGDRSGALGMILRMAKRSWEAPEVCAARLLRILQRPRWQGVPGEAPWLVEEREEPWPEATRRYAGEIMRALERHVSPEMRSP